MVILIDFNTVAQDAFSPGNDAQPIAATMFGGVSINVHTGVMGGDSYRNVVPGSDYADHFSSVYSGLSLNLLRFPGGEFPDGFLAGENGNWAFKHNKINGGNSAVDDPLTGDPLAIGDITQSYLDSLTPAFSLNNPELIDGHLLGSGRMSFSESLQLAVENGSSYSLVLPEFQYLKIPVNRDPDGDGIKTPFLAAEHVKLATLEADVFGFLENLFINGAYNNGDIPEDFVIELGNEDFFGWNKHYFFRDSAVDLDSYSAYALGSLRAIKDFRAIHPEIAFKVALQVGGADFAWELDRNFSDEGASDLFGQVDVISVIHDALDVDLADAGGLEDTQYIKDGINNLQGLIAAAGGDSSDTELLMSEWSAVSSDIAGLDGVNHALPAAGAALSLFSSMFEMGMDYAANWGIGAWGGFGTNLSSVDASGILKYAPIGEVYRQMAESLVGTTQIITPSMDGGRGDDFTVFAYEDNAKAVLFLAANDYTGTETVDLGNFGGIEYAWVERISATGNVADGFSTVVTREMVSFTGGSVTLTFNTPYEVLRIIVAKDSPGTGYLHLWGGEAGDSLIGGLSGDLLEGNGGDDILNGGAGNDTLSGGSGNDDLGGNTGDDMIYGGDGNDRIWGGAGVDVLNGEAGNDWLWAHAGDDVLNGGDGNDHLQGYAGNDILDGGAGVDYADYGNAAGAVSVYLTIGKSSGADGVDTLTGIENLMGSDYDDRLVGDAGVNVLKGGAGNDILKTKGGDDVVYGGTGDDTITGDTGNETLFGGDGADIIYALGGADSLNGGSGDDFLYGGQGGDTLDGGAGDDKLRGNLGADVLNGEDGGDDLRGGGGGDMLDGGAGADYLLGENGADILYGGAGDDVLNGGGGGGVGDGFADVFVYKDTATDGYDRIKDFENGIDRIDLTDFGFSSFADVSALTSQISGGVKVNFGGGNVLLLEGLALGDFDVGDVLI